MREMKSLLCDNAAWRPATVTAFLALLLSVCPFPALASFGADPGLFDILLTLAQLLYRFPCFFCISVLFFHLLSPSRKIQYFFCTTVLSLGSTGMFCVCVFPCTCAPACVLLLADALYDILRK